MGSCRSHILSNVPCEAFKIPYDRLLVTGGLSGQVWLVCLVPWVTRAGTYQSKHWPIWRLIWSFFPKKSKVWHTLDLVRCFKIDKDTLNAQGTLEISDNWYIHWKRNENISRIMSRGGTVEVRSIRIFDKIYHEFEFFYTKIPLYGRTDPQASCFNIHSDPSNLQAKVLIWYHCKIT